MHNTSYNFNLIGQLLVRNLIERHFLRGYNESHSKRKYIQFSKQAFQLHGDLYTLYFF
jgi:hypothetical protein